MARKCLVFVQCAWDRILRDWVTSFAWTGYAFTPWAFVTPSIAGAREDGKLSIDLAWVSRALYLLLATAGSLLLWQHIKKASMAAGLKSGAP